MCIVKNMVNQQSNHKNELVKEIAADKSAAFLMFLKINKNMQFYYECFNLLIFFNYTRMFFSFFIITDTN